MKKRSFLARLLAGACGVVSSSPYAQASHADAVPLRFATMDLPPYGWMDGNGEKRGAIYELLEEIGRRSGLPYANDIMPFARMLQSLKEGQVDALSSQAHQKALDSGEPLAVTHLVDVIVATKKGSGIASLDDLKGKTFVFHQGASYKQLEGIAGPVRHVNSYLQAVLVLHGRPDVQAAVFSAPAFHYFREAAGLKPEDFGRLIDLEVGKKQWLFVRHGLSVKTKARLRSIAEDLFREDFIGTVLRKYGSVAR